MLIYRNGPGGGLDNRNFALVWFDRSGKPAGAPQFGETAAYMGVELSPDGKRFAFHRHTGNGGDIWIADVERGTSSRLTFSPERDNSSPIWSPDGSRIAFAAQREGKWGLYLKNADGSGGEDLLIESAPDGRWIAYESDEVDRSQIYVRSYPSLRGRWQVSTERGVYPRWSADGKELFFFDLPSGGRLFSVAVTATATSFQSGPPKLLFANAYPANPTHSAGSYHHWALSADGQRFLIPRPASGSFDSVSLPIVVVVNWVKELKARAAAK